jgi:PhnB protein
MNNLTPYLFFDGNCREAMSFYKELFGGQLELMTYADAPPSRNPGEGCPDGVKDRIMHAMLKSKDLTLMASDTPNDDEPIEKGNNVQLALTCESLAQIDSVFKKLSEKGTVNAPLHDAFWGSRFGMVTDRFGMYWMLSCELSKK